MFVMRGASCWTVMTSHRAPPKRRRGRLMAATAMTMTAAAIIRGRA